MSAARRMLSMTFPPSYRERTTPLSLRVDELLEGPGRSSVEAHPASERTHLIRLQFEGDLRRSILRALLRVKDVDEAFGGRLYRVGLRIYLLELDAPQILAVDPQAYLSALDGLCGVQAYVQRRRFAEAQEALVLLDVERIVRGADPGTAQGSRSAEQPEESRQRHHHHDRRAYRREYPVAALGLQVLGDLKIPHALHLGHPLPPAPDHSDSLTFLVHLCVATTRRGHCGSSSPPFSVAGLPPMRSRPRRPPAPDAKHAAGPPRGGRAILQRRKPPRRRRQALSLASPFRPCSGPARCAVSPP